MVKTYDLLSLKLEEGGHWTVGIKTKAEPSTVTESA
jgi:hypothetical protein